MGALPRTPHPSPLQMLAILQAYAEGLSSHAIARRTGYSNASIQRWFSAWSHDAKTLDNWVREYEVDRSGNTFDDYYPKKQMAIPSPFAQSGERPPQQKLFRTLLGGR